MSNIWKRSLSMLLALVMVFGMMPMQVFATETDGASLEQVETPTEAPTEAPTEEPTEVPTEEPTEEPTEAPKAELSGETRKVYFHNVEGWDEVYAAWSFDEEDFEDVAFPGQQISAADALEDVYAVTVPVEADEVLFSDGVEVTDELLEEEKNAGLELTHEIVVRLQEKQSKNLYRNGAWENYAEAVAALQETEEPTEAPTEAPVVETEPPVMAPAPTEDPVQALIDTLPATVTNEDEYEAVYAVVAEIENNGYDLTAEQMDAVFAAMNAADEWFGAEEAGMYAGENWYWDGSTLYIKDGKITKAQLYAALDEKYDEGGYGSFKYAAQDSYNWTTNGTEVKSNSTGDVSVARGTGYVKSRGRLGYSTGGSKWSFTAEYYYIPSVTVTGKDGVTATITNPTDGKVIHGNSITFTLPAMGEDGWIAKYNGTTKELSATAATTITVENITSVGAAEISVELEKAVSHNVNISVNPDTPWGTASVDVTSGTKGTKVTVTATPNGVSGAYSYSVAKIEVDGTVITGNTFNIGDTDANVVVTFARNELETNANPEVLVNGCNKDTITNNLKAKLISAVLKNPGATTDYTVYVYLGLDLGILGKYDYVNLDDASLLNRISGWIDDLGGDFWIKVNGTINVKIVDKQGRTVTVDVATTESRKPATVQYSSATSGTFNTLEDFKSAVTNTISVLDNKNADCKADAGLTVTLNPVEGKANTYTVSYSLANDGETWLKTSGTLPGEVTWNVSAYKVTFKNDDGSVLSEAEYPYGTTADKITAPTATKANEVDANGNIIARYTFAGWNPAVDTVTDTATYTATYNRVVEEYTITWVNGDETTTEEYEYGATPVAPTASKTSTAQYHFINGTWGEIAAVTGDATYTATFTEELRSYTITWVNGDETETTTVDYGEMPIPYANPSKSADETYTYEDGTWGTLVKVEGETTYTATFTPTYIEYTITWVYNGKTEPVTYHYGDAIVAPNATDYVDGNTTYTFKGWDANGNGEAEVGETLPATATENITYKAIYSDLTVWDVTVKFGNGDDDATGKVEDGKTYTLPADPTMDGYRFDGWYVENTKVEDSITVTANTTITAKWVKIFTYKYSTEHDTAPEGATVDVNTVITIADLLKQNDLTDGIKMTGWYVGETLVSGEYTITGDVTFTAKWEADADNDNIVDGTDADPYWTIVVDGATVSTTALNGEYADPAAPADKANMFFTGWTKAVNDDAHTITFTSNWNTNDENDNNIDDSTEKFTITWDVGGKKTTEVYTYGETPSFKGSTDRATANYIKYTFTGWNATPAKVVADVTYTAQYSMELLVSDGTVKINGYWESKGSLGGGSVIFDTLKADTLKAAGITSNFDNYKVEYVTRLGNVDLDDFGYTGKSNFFLTVEVPESGRSVIITDRTADASKTVSMKIEDSRPSAGLVSKEFTDVKVLDKDDSPSDYINSLLAQVNPNGLNVKVELTEGTWPPAAAGETVKLVYTVSYESDASWIGGSATLTVYLQSLLNNCTVVPADSLTAGGSLTVSPSNDNMTVAGNSAVTITVKPNSDKVVETITVKKNGADFATFNTNQISYSSKNATVSFNSDGTEIADVYTVEVTYSNNYLTLKNGTIVYCMDNDDLINEELKALVFEAIFDDSSAPMNAGNVTLEYAYIGVGGYNLWQDISKGPAINLGSLTHKFGEDGSETIRIKYSDDKYGSFEQTVELNVFDSCYSAQIGIQTVAPAGTTYNFSVKYSAQSRAFQSVNYFKAGEAITVTLTPSGDDIGAILEQLYNKTYSETSPYIKSVKVMKKNADGSQTEVASTLERGNGELVDWDNILGGIGNPFAYTAAVTFNLEEDGEYEVVAEYDVLKLERYELSAQMTMYEAGEGYEAEVPSAQEIYEKILGKEYAANFLATYGGAFTVEFSTDLISYSWKAVSNEELLALNDGVTIRIRITWNPTDDNKIFYPVSQQADLTLVDTRKATSVQGSVPTEKVEYVEEDQLVANLKEAMGLGILFDGAVIDVEYDVNYTINVTDAGNTATVIVTYHGSDAYKPSDKTFENVPIADIPDNATIKVTIQNASDVVTNNAGAIMPLDPVTGIYTLIGNGTYNFQFTPVDGKAIESVTVNGEKLENVIGAGKATNLFYKNGVATFTLYLAEKEHYEVVVETVDSVWVLEDERVYNFATGITAPDNGDIANAATKYPTEIDFDAVILEYLARDEGKVTITLPDIDLGVYVIELGTFDVELGELWLNPEETVDSDLVSEDQLDKILEKLVEDLPGKITSGEIALTEAFDYIQNYVKNLPLGMHAFGAEGDGSAETVRFSYVDDKYTLAEIVTDVTIHDYRIATDLVANDCDVTYGYSAADLIAASGAAVYADGAVVSGLKIETDDLYLHAGEQSITLYFEGDETYQPCKVTLDVTVNKAVVAVDYDSQIITYGDAYNFALNVSPTTMPDGTSADVELIEFMIGLDAHKLLDLDPSDQEIGLEQAIGFIQLRLPKVIRELPAVGEYLQGEFTLSEFSDLINSLSDVLGIDESSIEILNQVIEAITGITDRVDIKVIVKDEDFHPKNIGVYIAGAVTIDADFETAYTADYLIIKPVATEVELAWNDSALTNTLVTMPVFEKMDKGASAVEEKYSKFPVSYLILGINNDTSEFLTTDIYGNIKANIWLNPEEIKDNGAYVQIAYGLKWGNEILYAVPIIRAFAVVPELYNVELVGATGTPNDELLKTFNNEAQGFGVIVKDNDGNIIYSDHYQNVVSLKENAQLIVNYAGVQTNGELVNLTTVLTKDNKNEAITKPVHAGVYAATAVYMEFNDGENLDISDLKLEDLYELFDLVDMGADVALLVIEPSESSVEVKDEIHIFGTPYDLKDLITVDSLNSDVTPDTTVIAAMIAATDDVSVNGLEGITGSVNVDFPRWVDGLIAEHVPGVHDGMTVGQLREKLLDNIPDISDKLAELGATNEIINSMSNLIGNVSDALDQLPDDVKLTFDDDVELRAVGAYLVMAVVTDSDHYPAVDAGVLIIAPDATEVVLKYTEDANNIFTPAGLKFIDLGAKAYDPVTGEEITDATAKVTNIFVGINAKGQTVVTDDPTTLDNGVYTEFSYILDVGGKMYVAEPISRVIALAPNTADVYFVDANGNKNADQLFVFDNTAKSMAVEVVVGDDVFTPAPETLTYNYVGVQTNGVAYNSAEHPVHAGIYAVTVNYSSYDENGKLLQFGAAIGAMAIEPAVSTMDVTGETVTYDGLGHTADVVATGSGVTEPDYTLISGGAYVSGNIDQIGVDAFHGNVNIDFPAWLDKVLAEYEFAAEGVNTAYLIEFITAYRDDALALIPAEKLAALGIETEKVNAVIEKVNAYIDELLAVLEKLPKDVVLTFEDDVTYTEPGYYFYYGIVTDSDHYPSSDTGLVVIEKKPLVFDLLNTTATWNGKGQMAELNNPENADFTTVVIDRKHNTINILLDEDAQYALNAVAKILGVEFDGDVQMSTIIEKYNGEELAAAIVELIGQLEQLELPEDVHKALAAVKKELETLPETGTIMINGDLPTELGKYEVYALTYSQYFETAAAEAVLEIVPVQVEVILDNITKTYGEADPALTYTVNYYDHLGNKLDDAGVVDVTVIREEGEDVGTYAISAVAKLNDDAHYVLIAQPESATFEITKAEDNSWTEEPGIEGWTYGEEPNAPTGEAKYGEIKVEYRPADGTEEDFTETVPTDAGDYIVRFTVEGTDNYNGVTVEKELTIAKAASAIKEAPEAVKDLTYTGKAQELVTAGTAEGGKVVYSLSENGPFTDKIPTGTDAGTYTVYYKVEGDENHTDGEVKSVEVVISEAASAIKEAPEAVKDLTYTGEAQELVTAGTAEGGKVVYSLSENGPFTDKIPTGTDAGTYTVYYKVEGDENHTDSEVKSVEVTISKATPDVKTPAGLTAMEGQTLADVKLPEGFTWADAETTSVGQPGENKFVVVFTPADSKNYESVRMEVIVTVEADNSKDGLYPIHMTADHETIVAGAMIYVDGVGYELDEDLIAYVPMDNATFVTTYVYNKQSSDTHEVYPTHMYVWQLTFSGEKDVQWVEGENYTAKRVAEFDDIMQYSGSSIRISGKKGIRMITSIPTAKRNTLINSNMLGWRLMQTGTCVEWADENGVVYNSLTMNTNPKLTGYAYKRGVQDPVFARTNGLDQFTNVLVGFNNDQCKLDLVMRPYMILENVQTGETAVLYGGMVQRSIGYIAYQNRLVYKPGNAAYDFIWDIIHHVYGNKYDADFKG